AATTQDRRLWAASVATTTQDRRPWAAPLATTNQSGGEKCETVIVLCPRQCFHN
ncbi:hypothetical protein LSAT2_010791, partial [Lamellibrachia satsuma]